MLVTPGDKRDALVDRKLAIAMASIAGAVNASAFYAVGFFSANMTGNASAFSDHIAQGAWSTAWLFLAIVCAFVLGAAASTTMISVAERREVRGRFALVILVEGVLLMPVTWFGGVSGTISVTVAWLAFLMGMQNAVTTHISNARVRTTHVSGMATDLGIEMSLAWQLRGAKSPEATANMTRLFLHLTTIAAFIVGGVIGVWVYQLAGSTTFLLCGLLLSGIGLGNLLRSSR